MCEGDCIDCLLGEPCPRRFRSPASKAAFDLLIARTRARIEAAFQPRRPIPARLRRPEHG